MSARCSIPDPSTVKGVPGLRTLVDDLLVEQRSHREGQRLVGHLLRQDVLPAVGKGPALVVVPAGQFEMGGEAAEEQPRHTVKFERPFAIGLYEVSVGEFAQFCKATNG